MNKLTDVQIRYAATMAAHYTEAVYFTDSGEEDDPVTPDTVLSEEAAGQIARDCRGFVQVAWPLLIVGGWPADQAGHDLWMTRNGYGVGFWDRKQYKYGDELSEICRAFGESHVYTGEDGRAHFDNCTGKEGDQ